MQPGKHIGNKLTAVRLLLIVSLLVLFTSPAPAQRYPFYNLNVENGLIQSQATCFTQDKFGNLWVGTIGGISRYDGKNITNYTVRNGLLNNMVDALATDREGNIWIGSPEGVSRFNGKTFKHFIFPSDERTGVKWIDRALGQL